MRKIIRKFEAGSMQAKCRKLERKYVWLCLRSTSSVLSFSSFCHPSNPSDSEKIREEGTRELATRQSVTRFHPLQMGGKNVYWSELTPWYFIKKNKGTYEELFFSRELTTISLKWYKNNVRRKVNLFENSNFCKFLNWNFFEGN